MPSMRTNASTSPEPMAYEVEFSDGTDEVAATSLDEACQIAECLVPDSQRLLRVEGSDGCRVFEEIRAARRAA